MREVDDILEESNTNSHFTSSTPLKVADEIISDSQEQLDIQSNISHHKSKPLYNAALIGFIVGLVICEICQTGRGQPALVYLVPSMVVSIGLVGAKNKELLKMWKFE